MRTNKSYKSETALDKDVVFQNKITGKLHLNAWPSTAKVITFGEEFELTPGEQSVCDMATD